jgi:hypothetical protein
VRQFSAKSLSSRCRLSKCAKIDSVQVIPGAVSAYCLRVDSYSDEKNKYFITSLLAHHAGLIMAMTAAISFE